MAKKNKEAEKWVAVGGGGSIMEGAPAVGRFVSAERKKSDLGKGYYFLIELADSNGEVLNYTASDTIKEQIAKVEKGQKCRITNLGKRTAKKIAKGETSPREYNKYLVEVAE